MTTIAIVYHSGYGHTQHQANAIFEGINKLENTNAIIYTCDEAIEKLDALDEVDGIIFGSPTYMGSMSAEMKKFVEAASKKWFTQSWKDKVAGVFTNSTSFSGDKLNTLSGLMIQAMQHSMIFIGTGIMPAANKQEEFEQSHGPGPDALNRVGSFLSLIHI